MRPAKEWAAAKAGRKSCPRRRTRTRRAHASEAAKEHLALSDLVFTVTEWSEARVTARSDTPHGDLMLRIVGSERLVRLSYWDTRPEFKDKDGAASGFVWELQ